LYEVTVGNTTTDLLDEVKKANGIESDYALAKRLDVLPQTISNYRHGRTQMSDEIAVAMAAMIERAPAPILAQLAAERAKSPEVAKVWREAAKALARIGRGGKAS
jgi:plasmid maintenance system antidote protein VapI